MERQPNRFTEEEMNELKTNPYVSKVSETNITYSEEFKKVFLEKYNKGETPQFILRTLGFDPKVLKKDRVKNIVRSCKKFALRPEGKKDLRGKFKTKREKLTPEEEIVQLKHKNLVLEQENLFLKKMISFVKVKQMEKSSQGKNIQ